MTDRVGRDINEIWAWIVLDENGDESIPTFRQGNNVLPCIGATAEAIQSLRPLILAAVMPLRPVKLCRFRRRTVVEVLRHEGGLDS